LAFATLWFIINCNMYFRMMAFFWIHISQGSVATRLGCGGIFVCDIVTNCWLSLTVIKKIKNRIIVSEVMAKRMVSCFFDSRCIMYMFMLSRTASWCSFLINSSFVSFFWGCQRSALLAVLKTPSGSVSFSSWLLVQVHL